MSRWPEVTLGEVLHHRKEFIEIDDLQRYRRPRVQLHAQGVVLRDEVEGAVIRTKKQQVCHADELLVAEIDAKVGGYGIVPPALNGAIVSSHYFLFVADERRLDPRYLEWYVRTSAFGNQVQAQGSTNYAAIRPAHVLEYTMPLPPIEGQRRAVEKLNRLADRAAMIRTAQLRSDTDSLALRRVLYGKAERDALRRGARVPLSRLIASHDSGWSPQCEDDPASPGTWGVLKTTCVQWDGLRAGANKALRPALAPRPELAVRKGDILITRAGPVNRVGVACVVPEDHAFLMLSDKIVRMVPVADVDPDFIVAMLGAPSAQEYFRQSKTGLAASQVNISRARLLALEMPLPALHEQRRVATALLRSLSALDRCTQKRQEGTPVVAAFERAMLRVVFD